MRKYLLPCDCGAKVPVDTSQAGLSVTCACGKKLDVPTLGGLRTLEVSEAAPEAATSSGAPPAWGPGQGLLFLGTIATLCGVIALAWVLPKRPEWTVQSEQIAVAVDTLTPAQLYARWQDLRKGLGGANDPVRQQYDAEWATYRRRAAMAALPLGLGVLLLASGFFLRRSGTSPPRSPS